MTDRNSTETQLRVPRRDPDIIRRMRITLDLAESAVQLMRQNLRRRHPEANEEEISARLREWLQSRPGDHTSASFRRSSRLSELLSS